MHKRHFCIAILTLCGIAAAPHARALGFGRIPESIAFGQALDLSVPLQIEAGEGPSPGCLRAVVSIGERQLPPAAVQVRLERTGEGAGGARVRVRSALVVQEPLVGVNLSVGCDGTLARHFVVFADPPASVTELPRVTEAAPTRVTAPSAASTHAESAAPRAPRPAAKPTPRSERAGAPIAWAQAVDATAAGAARPAKAAPPPEPALPRLRLEEPEALRHTAMLAVAAQEAALANATQVANAAQAAASAAEQRVAALERNLQDTRMDAAAQGAVMEQMRTGLARAEDQGRMQSALAVAVVAVTALALWLGWRLRALQRERQAGWWQGASAPIPSPERAVSVDNTSNNAPPASPAAALAAPAVDVSARMPDVQADVAQPPGHRTAVLPPTALVEHTLTRPVSVDELIDLEQQAEFFVLLGEEGAAIDLLRAHLRSTEGSSPLPYLNLLDIYRRRQDHGAYDRLCKRFTQRFDAVPPEWNADPSCQRDLQDYPVALATLQAVWRSPPEALAELENLLFRSRGGELYELQAYRDVLTLYAVARDLHRQIDHVTDHVDVLLPLGAAHDPTATLRHAGFDRLEPAGAHGVATTDDRPSAAIDLDLSDLDGPPESLAGEATPVFAPLVRGC